MSIQPSAKKPQGDCSRTLIPWRLIQLDIPQKKPNWSKRLKIMRRDNNLKAHATKDKLTRYRKELIATEVHRYQKLDPERNYIPKSKENKAIERLSFSKHELRKLNHENYRNSLQAGRSTNNVPDEFIPLKFAHQMKGTKPMEERSTEQILQCNKNKVLHTPKFENLLGTQRQNTLQKKPIWSMETIGDYSIPVNYFAITHRHLLFGIGFWEWENLISNAANRNLNKRPFKPFGCFTT